MVRMMLCMTPRLFLIIHIASPLCCISLFSPVYFPALRHFFIPCDLIGSWIFDFWYHRGHWLPVKGRQEVIENDRLQRLEVVF